MKQTAFRPSLLLFFLAVFAAGVLPCQASNTALFERPAELEPLISFWIEIFTKYDGDCTIIHDEDDPSVRYETVGTAGTERSAPAGPRSGAAGPLLKILENLALKAADR